MNPKAPDATTARLASLPLDPAPELVVGDGEGVEGVVDPGCVTVAVDDPVGVDEAVGEAVDEGDDDPEAVEDPVAEDDPVAAGDARATAPTPPGT